MFKIKIRPHKHNRYLYYVAIYERATCFGFNYWKFWSSNDSIADWGVDKYIASIRETMKVTAIDFQLQEEFKP